MIFDIFLTDSSKKSAVKVSGNDKPGIGFSIIKSYVRFFHDKIYYRKVYTINAESIPQNCPLMIVSNHQNCLFDPLGILMSVRSRKDRKIKVIARANVFKNPVANKVLRYLGLIPAFRLSHDGAETLLNNFDSFNEVEDELLNDGTVIIYPEAGHQDKRWLGKFSYGYLRILFEAAEKSNFEKEMFVLPSCNHYSDYFDLREELVIKYGTPISLAPYYELYKTKPRTAQRKVNAIVRAQVEDLMLNITDLDNYNSIDYIRNTYGIKYAGYKGLNPDNLSEKLFADKQLFNELEKLKLSNEQEITRIYNDVSVLNEKSKELKIKDIDFDKKHKGMNAILESVLFIVFLPLFIFSLIPNILILIPSKLINPKIKDPMMHNTVLLVISLIFTIPVLYLLMFGLTWMIRGSFIVALLYLVCLPFLGIFAWNYNKAWNNFRSRLRFNKLLKKGKIDGLISLRESIHKSLDELLNNK